MANLCIIPARGGSKRIPRKNIKPFLGKPIIAYSIEAALKSNLFDEVMVSTDDTEIAEIAKKHGAKVPFMRSKKNSDDFATTMDVLQEVMESYKMRGQLFENVCCIYPCAPLLTVENLLEAFDKLTKNNKKTVFPIIEFSFPIQRALKLEDSNLSFDQPEFALSRSQDLPKRYHDAGQFYFFRVKTLMEEQKIIGDSVGAIVISEMDAQDIDNETDWKLAEIKYQLRKIARKD